MSTNRTRASMRARLGAVVAGGALVALVGGVRAQDNSAAEIEKYRQMLQEGNPAELTVAKGEDLWKTPRGPGKRTLEQCDLGLGPGVVKGAYARLPRYFADTDQTMDFESRLVHCMVTQQGFKREEEAAPAAPTKDQELLSEIRDLLKEQRNRSS